MKNVRVLAEAKQEAIEAAQWYERERAGLGTEFFKAIENAQDLLKSDLAPLVRLPKRIGKQGFMRLVLERFPYDVVVQ